MQALQVLRMARLQVKAAGGRRRPPDPPPAAAERPKAKERSEPR